MDMRLAMGRRVRDASVMGSLLSSQSGYRRLLLPRFIYIFMDSILWVETAGDPETGTKHGVRLNDK